MKDNLTFIQQLSSDYLEKICYHKTVLNYDKYDINCYMTRYRFY